ncbi:hypothetical protein GCM10029992_31660 [Glycomyces albus]
MDFGHDLDEVVDVLEHLDRVHRVEGGVRRRDVGDRSLPEGQAAAQFGDGGSVGLLGAFELVVGAVEAGDGGSGLGGDERGPDAEAAAEFEQLVPRYRFEAETTCRYSSAWVSVRSSTVMGRSGRSPQ